MEYLFEPVKRFTLSDFSFKFLAYNHFEVCALANPSGPKFDFYLDFHPLGMRITTLEGVPALEVGHLIFNSESHLLSLAMNFPGSTWSTEIIGDNLRLGFGTEDLRGLRIGHTEITYDVAQRPLSVFADAGYLKIRSAGAMSSVPVELPGLSISIPQCTL